MRGRYESRRQEARLLGASNKDHDGVVWSAEGDRVVWIGVCRVD